MGYTTTNPEEQVEAVVAGRVKVLSYAQATSPAARKMGVKVLGPAPIPGTTPPVITADALQQLRDLAAKEQAAAAQDTTDTNTNP